MYQCFPVSIRNNLPIKCTYLVEHLTEKLICRQVCVSRGSYSYPILTQNGMYQDISAEVPNIQFYEDLFLQVQSY